VLEWTQLWMMIFWRLQVRCMVYFITTLTMKGISDTKVGLYAGFASFPRHTFPNTPPIVLVSQLYSSVTNRTDVDRELDTLKREGVIHIFKLLSGNNDYAAISREDYIKNIRKSLHNHPVEQTQVFERFIEKVVPNYNDIQIHKTKLLELLFEHTIANTTDLQKDSALTALVNANIVLVHEINHFWFCIPNSGSFIASLVKGRKEIVSILKRQKFKELLLTDLQKKKLRYSSLSIEFLIKDMIGLNIIARVSTTSGYLIQLKDATW